MDSKPGGLKAAGRALLVAALLVLLIGAPAAVIGYHLSHRPSARVGGSLQKHPDDGSVGHRDRTPAPDDKAPVRSAAKKVVKAISQTDAVSSYEWVASANQSGTGTQVAITSTGTASLDPLAIEEMTTGSPVGDVAIRMDSTDVWYAETGTSTTIPAATAAGWDGPDPFADFMSLAGSYVGEQLKAIMTFGTASPAGEIAIAEQAVAGATPSGSVTVDGQPAEQYDVQISTAGFLHQPGLTSGEREALEAAVSELDDLPLQATVDVSSAGYVVQVAYTVTLSGGATVSSQRTYSDFNAAVSVAMPPAPSAKRNGGPNTIIASSTSCDGASC